MLFRIFDRERLRLVLPFILIAIVTFWIGLSAYSWERERGVKPSFYQSYYEPAVRMACGQSFGVDPSGALTDDMKRFLRLEAQTLSCDSVPLPAVLDPKPPTIAWYHLFASTALIWKFTGVSWPILDGLAAALLSISATMLFALFRLLTPVPVAFGLAIISILPALNFLLYLRDLNKAPFILAALLVIAWLVLRTPTRLRLCGVMAMLGLWLGIGYGFRPDILIVLPLLIATILFFRPLPLRSTMADSMIASLVLLSSFVIAASPILLAFIGSNGGSCQWHWGLLGLSDIHTGILGLIPANYSWLNHYNDLIVWRSVESYGERVFSLPATGYCTPLYDQVSKALYLEIFRTFPADFMTRGVTAAWRVISPDLWNVSLPKFFPSWNFFVDNRGFIHGALLLSWVVLVLATLAWNIRVGLILICAVAYISAYPAIQFDYRHYFHLAFLTLLPLGVAVGWMYSFFITALSRGTGKVRESARRLLYPRAWGRSAAILVGISITFLLVYISARQIQVESARQLFERYLQANGAPITLELRPVSEGRIALTTIAPDYRSPNNIHGRMLRLEIGGSACFAGTKKISMELGRADNPNHYFRKDLIFDFDFARKHATVFFPVYFQQGVISDVSLVMPPEDIDCIKHAAWLRSEELPSLWVQAILYPDWRQERLYQRK
jgi:hypothetical protein